MMNDGTEFVGGEIRAITQHNVTLMDGRVFSRHYATNKEITAGESSRTFEVPAYDMPPARAVPFSGGVQVTPSIGGQGGWNPSFQRQFPVSNVVPQSGMVGGQRSRNS